MNGRATGRLWLDGPTGIGFAWASASRMGDLVQQPETVSHYRIRERLGAGGMGVVYKADDTKLERAVAIKLLHASALADPDRLQRFVQEAKTTSALNHPNIATIHQLGEYENQHYIVMELVQGETLRDRLRRGGLEMRDVVDLGVQVAEGLAAAHDAGVVHRDLKPENLMLRPDGLVKILDFGLAKLLQVPGRNALGLPAGGGDETILQSAGAAGSPGGSRPTMPGMVMGTVGYMAPEQVRGDTVDARADLFALGCVLYEATTAQRAFGTASAIEVMHAILKEHPRPLHEARPDAPVELERIVRKALAKNPNERYQSAKDLAIDLRNLRREIDSGNVSATYALPSGAVPVPSWPSGAYAAGGAVSAPGIPAVAAPQTAPAPTRARRRILLGVIPVVVAGLATVALFLKDRRQVQAPPRGPLQITRLTSTGKADWPALSPDGKYAAFTEADAGKTSITLRQIATNSTVQLLPPVDDAIGGLVFAPDGNWLYFLRVPRQALLSTLYRVPALGGTPQKLFEDVDSPPTLSPDSKQLAFMRHTPPLSSDIYVAASDGSGTPRILVGRGAEYNTLPQWSPDGKFLALVARDPKDLIHAWMALAPVAGGPPQRIPGSGWSQVRQYCWTADGKAFLVSGMRETQALTLQIFRQPTGGGEPRQITADLNNYFGVSVSTDGAKLVSLRGFTQGNFWKVPGGADAAANTRQAEQIDHGTSRADYPSPSPDGRAFVYISDAGNGMHLWTMDANGANARAITAGAQTDLFPAWSPDGLHIAYTTLSADSVRVWVMSADGTGARQLSFGVQSSCPTWSPDSRWVAYHATQGETSVTWKVPVEGGTPVQVSEGMAAFPLWSPDGARLLCLMLDGNNPVLAVLPATGGAAQPTPIPFRGNMMNFAWAPDSKHVIGVLREGGASNLATYSLVDGKAVALTQFPAGPQILSFAPWRDGSGFIVQRGTTTRDAVLVESFQ